MKKTYFVTLAILCSFYFFPTVLSAGQNKEKKQESKNEPKNSERLFHKSLLNEIFWIFCEL